MLIWSRIMLKRIYFPDGLFIFYASFLCFASMHMCMCVHMCARVCGSMFDFLQNVETLGVAVQIIKLQFAMPMITARRIKSVCKAKHAGWQCTLITDWRRFTSTWTSMKSGFAITVIKENTRSYAFIMSSAVIHFLIDSKILSYANWNQKLLAMLLGKTRKLYKEHQH